MNEEMEGDPGQTISDFFMVGDSPEIDIKGGKDNGFTTVLVESGLYKPSMLNENNNDTNSGTPCNNNSNLTQYLKYADHIVPNVHEAVKLILTKSEIPIL